MSSRFWPLPQHTPVSAIEKSQGSEPVESHTAGGRNGEHIHVESLPSVETFRGFVLVIDSSSVVCVSLILMRISAPFLQNAL